MQNDAIALRLRRLEKPPDGHAAPERSIHLPAVELVADTPQRREPVRQLHGLDGLEIVLRDLPDRARDRERPLLAVDVGIDVADIYLIEVRANQRLESLDIERLLFRLRKQLSNLGSSILGDLEGRGERLLVGSTDKERERAYADRRPDGSEGAPSSERAERAVLAGDERSRPGSHEQDESSSAGCAERRRPRMRQSIREDGRRDRAEGGTTAPARQHTVCGITTQQERRAGEGDQAEDRAGRRDGRQERQPVTQRSELGDREGHERVRAERHHESIERRRDEGRPSPHGQVGTPHGGQPRGERNGDRGEPRTHPGDRPSNA